MPLTEAVPPSPHETGREPSVMDPRPVLICLSHLRWNFVYQRPQHLISRFARRYLVIYFEEPLHAACEAPRLHLRVDGASGVTVAQPHFPEGTDFTDIAPTLRTLLDEMVADLAVVRPVLWFYTPMMLPVAGHLEARAVVYDCMDDLSRFLHAPPDLIDLERALMRRANLVFTGGVGLYEARRGTHGNIHAFPSGVDAAHFTPARAGGPDPWDQAALPRPRFGYYGVIDERLDLDLLAAVARARPDWCFVMVGPVLKIDDADLPALSNVHFLDGKSYDELPAYLGGWDVALMPFALNEATRFISPTKTLEYLAGGRPVVSTPVRDVVRSYGGLAAVRVAEGAAAFEAACADALAFAARGDAWLEAVDARLARSSWDAIQAEMDGLLDRAIERASRGPAPRRPAPEADVLVVGAGLAGSVMAERLAGSGRRVLVVDQRTHLAGNAHDTHDAAGLLVHRYGPHIFHTNSDEVAAYLSRFTAWRPYEHRVLACLPGRDGHDLRVPMPINRTTLDRLYGLDLRCDEAAAAFLAEAAEPKADIRTSEDFVVAQVGRDLYERFFRGYTRKQWGLDPSLLDKSVAARVPARTGTDDRYFTDAFQAMPRDGYTRMVERMLDGPGIAVRLGTAFTELDASRFGHVVFTGPIDEYFGFRYGALPYRSLRFEHETLDCERMQEVGTVNYPDESVPYTRVTEFKHLTGQTHARTSIVREYPTGSGDPYYPVPRPENRALFKRYEALARALPGVTFVGRLATYRYYNMDQVVGQALAASRALLRTWTAAAAAE